MRKTKPHFRIGYHSAPAGKCGSSCVGEIREWGEERCREGGNYTAELGSQHSCSLQLFTYHELNLIIFGVYINAASCLIAAFLYVKLALNSSAFILVILLSFPLCWHTLTVSL